MRTGTSDILSQGQGRRLGLNAKPGRFRKSRNYPVKLEGLESRTLLATIPAATATGTPVDLSNLSSVTTNGSANSPAVAIDPYDSQNIFAVWGVDESQEVPDLLQRQRLSRGRSLPTAGRAGLVSAKRLPPRSSTSPPSTPPPRPTIPK